MSSELRWEDHISVSLREIASKSRHTQDDLYQGAKVILDDAKDRAPVRPKAGTDPHPHLATTGRIERDRGGVNTVAIVFSGPYARWVHEHVNFKHPFGGEAKFLEIALLMKGQDAINEAGQRFWRRL